MQSNQQLNKMKFFCQASSNQRIISGIVFLGLAALFFVLWLMNRGVINAGLLIDPCGFKQTYDLPCPTCGMTTCAISFVGGKIYESFYIQPAGALLCCLLVVIGFLTLLTAVFGVYFSCLRRFFAEIKIKHIILVLIVLLMCGWAVTIARALAVKS